MLRNFLFGISTHPGYQLSGSPYEMSVFRRSSALSRQSRDSAEICVNQQEEISKEKRHRFRISSFPERSSGKEREELCRSAVLWAFNTVRLYGFRVDGRGGGNSLRLIER